MSHSRSLGGYDFANDFTEFLHPAFDILFFFPFNIL